jgi:hypothetical protein
LEQLEALVAVPLLQLGAAHWVVGYTHAPVGPQAVAPQVPPVVHAPLQHVPPRHTVEEQASAAVLVVVAAHIAPGPPCGAQVPDAQ